MSEKNTTKYISFLILLLILCGCSSEKENNNNYQHKYISHSIHAKYPEADLPSLSAQIPKYSWQRKYESKHLYITKDFFRCRGSSNNPIIKLENGSELKDCNGFRNHSLPLRGTSEFIYPTLIKILNYLQKETGRRVVITCGHRCPEHNKYSDPSNYNQNSKHMIGAEVDFYLEGLEYQPETVVKLILDYYKNNNDNQFKRYTKNINNVSTHPWYNNEIFIKLFKADEGRDLDNAHPYPYLSIQMRYDYELNQTVSYSWESAFHNYLRW